MYRESHRRWNPLREEWVLVSPHRATRPWSGQIEPEQEEHRPAYDPSCYLCPGNKRANSAENPRYENVFAFDNDFPALSPAAEDDELLGDHPSYIRAERETGRCRVLCFSPRHDLTLADLSTEQILGVIGAWEREYEMLTSLPGIAHVMTFENKGAMMGCSNPHPHGQIWATAHIPNYPLRTLDAERRHFAANGAALLSDYLAWEEEKAERIVAANEHFVALVPFWAVWPFECMIVPKRPVACIDELMADEKAAWASLLSVLTVKYDNLFGTSFPYSMGVFQAPSDRKKWPGHVLHQSFYPPLLRSASVRKFMVGYELCAEPQRDITPETAAARLREAPEILYRKKT